MTPKRYPIAKINILFDNSITKTLLFIRDILQLNKYIRFYNLFS